MKKIFAASLTLTALVLAGCQPMDSETVTPTQEETQQTESSQTTESTQGGIVVHQVFEDGTSQEVGIFATQEPTQEEGMEPVEGLKGMVISEAGFNPSELTFKVGTKLLIQNIGKEQHWPASDPHPVHTDHPEFDAKKGLAPGETFEFTFDEPGVYTFHDHLNATSKAKVTVTE